MAGVQSILASHRQLSTTHNLLILLLLLITLLTTTSGQPQPQPQPQQPRPSAPSSSSSSSFTKPTTPTLCNIELEKSWCPTGQSCFVTSTTLQCHPTSTTTSGWIITSNLNIAFLNPSPSQLLLSNATCLPLPVPVSNSTHQEILILALKRHDAYYRTSTILISEDPAAILRGVSTCKNPMERCVDGWCVPVLGYGDICAGNDECYNPPRSFNSSTPYNINMSDEPEQSNNTRGAGNEPFGLVCDYEIGKLDQPPKCINYIRAYPRPDADQNRHPPVEQQKRHLHWIFAIVVLVVIIAFVLLFMCWRKTHGCSSSGGGGEDETHYQPYNGGYPETAEGAGAIAGGTEKCTEYLSTNYLSGLSTPRAVGHTGPSRGGGRKGSASSQNSAHSTVSWSGNGRRLSVAEKMVLDRDRAQDHEFMNRMSQSRRPGTFHRIEQLATGKEAGSAGVGTGVGPLSMGPSRRSMSFDPMQVYPAAITPAHEVRGGRNVFGGGGHARVRQLQEPSPPPNTPESQLPATMSSLG